MSSIKEIAEITGLSPATVSHAINGTRGVSKKSRELVEKAVRETGYIPNLAAQMLKTNKSHIIALILPTIEVSPESCPYGNSIFFELLNGAREHLSQNGYELLVVSYSEMKMKQHMEGIAILDRKLVDGVLVVPFSRSEDALQDLRKLDLPMVLSDRRVDGSDLPMVYADNYEGCKQLIRLLIKQGHKRIAFLGGSLETSVGYDRWRGYLDVLEELGFPKDKDLIRVIDKVELSAGSNATGELIDNGADAICISNHVLMLGSLSYCNQRGLKIPEDIAIVGTDNYDWMHVLPSPITTTTQNNYTIGEKSAEMLLRLLNGEDVSGQKYILPCRIILGSSHLGRNRE